MNGLTRFPLSHTSSTHIEDHLQLQPSAPSPRRLPAATEPSLSHASTSPNPLNPQPSANDSPTSCSLCFAQGHKAVECPSGLREATSEQAVPHQPSFHAGTPSVRQNALQKSLSSTEHQQASSPTIHSSSNPSSPPPPVPAPPAASIQSSAKPNSLKRLVVNQSPLLNQQQQDALERFKKKVRAQTQSQGQQLIGSTSANPFGALIEDQSDEEDDNYSTASFNSDTDDGPVEPIDMGYQSADGRSSHNHTKSSASIMKINKRHPNIPLNVRLRARKNSYSSYHKYL